MENPSISSGIMFKDSQGQTIEQLIAELEEHREKTFSTQEVITKSDLGSEPKESDKIDEVKSSLQSLWPSGLGHLTNLPRLSKIELSELLEDIVLDLQTSYGYQNADPDILQTIPTLPDGVYDERVQAYKSPKGYHVLRMGYWQYKSRAPRFGIYGGILTEHGDIIENPDITPIETVLQHSINNIQEMRQGIIQSDLENKIIQLSYIDVAGAINALKGLGINTIDKTATIPDQIQFKDLPFIVELSSPTSEYMGLVGKSGITKGEFGSSSMPPLASELSPDMIASPTTRLMVLFHPAHPEQFSRVQNLIHEVIDRPARQIYVEGMVIEITEAGLKQLGMEWAFQDGKFRVSGGSLSTNIRESLENLGDTLSLLGDSTQNFASEWLVNIRALLVDGKAEVLSRPSVLALNNRQATIRIGEDIPIATSQEGIQSDSSKISFDFKYISTGILLNLRPRVSQDGREISLMIDIIVSARKPESDLEIRDEDGQLLATAPTITNRRVQTYARIQNNTPFIIGGLVSRNDIKIFEKVPLLGDLPLLGVLFRSESSRKVRNEVIIVLTPYVLPEKLHLSRALPAEGKYFDDKDSELFRKSFRIQSGDILNVSFLYRNERFQKFRNIALDAIKENYTLAERDPFHSFAEGRLPGERVLVNHIIYNTLTRLGLADSVNRDLIFLLTDQDSGGYQAEYLQAILTRLGGDGDTTNFFTKYPDKALAISFYDLYESPNKESLVSEPVPQLKIYPCPDRKAWTKLLWELNQPTQEGRKRYTVLIHREEDIQRLQKSILIKYILTINGGKGPEASLLKFIPGRVLEMPNVNPERAHVINAEVARYFFHSSEHFYTATIEQIENTLKQLENELKTKNTHRL